MDRKKNRGSSSPHPPPPKKNTLLANISKPLPITQKEERQQRKVKGYTAMIAVQGFMGIGLIQTITEKLTIDIHIYIR
jgi:hypothetical protein